MLSIQNLFYLCNPKSGEVSEWSKEHAWKVCIPQKGIEGSNPSLSAKWKYNLSGIHIKLLDHAFTRIC